MFLTFLGTVASSKKTTAAIPAQSWSVYVDCADLQNSNTVYTQQGVSITIGPIYTNESLTTPYANAGFVYNYNRYSTDGSGTPTNLGGCPNIIPVYNASLTAGGNYAAITLLKTNTNEWYAIGNLL